MTGGSSCAVGTTSDEFGTDGNRARGGDFKCAPAPAPGAPQASIATRAAELSLPPSSSLPAIGERHGSSGDNVESAAPAASACPARCACGSTPSTAATAPAVAAFEQRNHGAIASVFSCFTWKALLTVAVSGVIGVGSIPAFTTIATIH